MDLNISETQAVRQNEHPLEVCFSCKHDRNYGYRYCSDQNCSNHCL